MSVAMEARKFIDHWLGIPAVGALRLIRGVGRRKQPGDAHHGSEVRKILAIKLWGVGNLTMVLPLLRGVRRAHPRARIDLLTLEPNRAMAEGCAWLDSVFTVPAHGALGPLVALVGLARRFRKRRYDLVLDFEQFLKTSALLTHAISPRRSVGFATQNQHRHGLHDVHVRYGEGRHMALVFGDIVRAAGISTDGLPPLFVPRSKESACRIDRIVGAFPHHDRPLITLHIGSGDNFPGRRWPAGHFAQLADLLWRERHAVIVFTGTAAERRVVSRCRAAMQAPSIDLTDALSVTDLVEFLSRTDLLVSNDSAPVHIASALGIPVIALYGPNTPDLYGPLSAKSRAYTLRLQCSPCITNSNGKTSFCRKPLCMQALRVNDVAAGALSMLEDTELEVDMELRLPKTPRHGGLWP